MKNGYGFAGSQTFYKQHDFDDAFYPWYRYAIRGLLYFRTNDMVVPRMGETGPNVRPPSRLLA